uniref:Cytoplasmic protein n=1 Tax=Vibrio genomosp. F6 TaxID=723172 RepID=A0A0H4A066_9VIBR|nr:Putative cytoplasmic protein [Vibrio genomosp. F6]
MNIQAMKSLSDEMTNVMPWLQGITSDEQYHEVLDLGVAMLRVIIDQHQLTQSDFKNEIGEKSLVSLILKGERSLTLPHIRALSSRFSIPTHMFV